MATDEDISNMMFSHQEEVEIKDEPKETSGDVVEPEPDPSTVLKQSVDRLLAFYCDLRTHRNDYQDEEFDSMEHMAVQYLGVLFPKLNREDKALEYLELYFQIHTLTKTQERRMTLLNSYQDVMQFCEKEELFLDACRQLQQQIQVSARQLDSLTSSHTQVGQRATPTRKTSRHGIEDLAHGQRPKTRRGNRRN